MATLLSISVRNVLRHPRRTGITSAAVALGVVFMTVASGFLDFTFWGLRQSIVYDGLGHLQILPVSLDARVRLRSDLVEDARTLLRGDPAVEFVAARLEFQGLVTSGARTLTFSGVGVEADNESKIRALMMVTAGRWFTGRERVPQALVGSGLASRLQVRPRDVVSLIVYSDRGSMSAVDVRVAGIFESGVIEYDARALLVPLATARELMASTGASGLAVTLLDAAATRGVVSRLERWLGARGEAARVARWDQLSPIYAGVVKLYQWILDVFLVIVTMVVVLGITNTMSMAVLERLPEVGVLRALGFGALRIVLMFLLEAATIGATGGVAGVVLGVVACLAISSMGIEMPPPPGHSQGYIAEVHIVLNAFVRAAAIAMGSAFVAAIGPSIRAIRREVSDVLRAT
ncbi:MAG: ABC transporter permease [Deltaproteobacteria bacterium]|nr:ABC transporter permease [Deltaproteobacteria bacterium]